MTNTSKEYLEKDDYEMRSLRRDPLVTVPIRRWTNVTVLTQTKERIKALVKEGKYISIAYFIRQAINEKFVNDGL